MGGIRSSGAGMTRKIGRVDVDPERCKACGLCIHFCPQNCFVPGETLNQQGNSPVKFLEEAPCTACALCAIVCPDMALKVWNLQVANPQEVSA
jgi:2-oxoglutarate ferredoxin oxidoreductase subunit delta